MAVKVTDCESLDELWILRHSCFFVQRYSQSVTFKNLNEMAESAYQCLNRAGLHFTPPHNQSSILK